MRGFIAGLILLCAALGLGLVPAGAETDVYDGVSIGQIGAVFRQVSEKHGLAVEDRTSKAGTPYLYVSVPGTEFGFIATGIGCRALGGRCNGFMYVLGDPSYKAPPDLVLAFNNGAFFAKLVPMPDVTVLRMEVLADGGITAGLIDKSLLAFAARINDYRSLKGEPEVDETQPKAEEETVPPSAAFAGLIGAAAKRLPRGGWQMPGREAAPGPVPWRGDDALIDLWARP